MQTRTFIHCVCVSKEYVSMLLGTWYQIMKKELQHFKIESSYGGNQNWFRDPSMYMGGCAAATACDSCINLALYKQKENLYPYNINRLDKESYIKFSKIMKPYLRPRLEGIKRLKLFIDGFQKFKQDMGEAQLKVTEFSGEISVEKAKKAICIQIDGGMPIPFLLLKHKNPNMKNITWHWFLVVGYEEYEDEFFVKIATYGDFHWLSLKELWNTGYREKGGMIIFNND